MPSLSHTETLGFAANVLKALEIETEALRAIGLDPEAFVKRLQTAYDRTGDLNASQEAQKRQAQATTAEYVASTRDLYVIASGSLDVLIAAVKKNSDAAKNLRQLRSRIRKRPDGDREAGKGRPPSDGSE